MNKSKRRKYFIYFIIIVGSILILSGIYITFQMYKFCKGVHQEAIWNRNFQPKYRLNDSVYVIMRKHFFSHSGEVSFLQQHDTIFVKKTIGKTDTLVIDNNKDTTVTNQGDSIIVRRK